jgi:four helix bundle protein
VSKISERSLGHCEAGFSERRKIPFGLSNTRIARGSLHETLEHLITAFGETYIKSETLKDMKEKHDTCLRLLNGHIRYLKKSKRGELNEK